MAENELRKFNYVAAEVARILNGDFPEFCYSGSVDEVRQTPVNPHWYAYALGEINDAELRSRLDVERVFAPCWHCGSTEEIHFVEVIHVTAAGHAASCAMDDDWKAECPPYRVARCGMCGALGAPGWADVDGSDGKSAREAWNTRA